MKLFYVAAAALLLPVSAGAMPMDHSGHHMKPAVSRALAKNPAVRSYVAANAAMHTGMDVVYTGNADIDFTRGMIPHHQGAIDMVAVLHRYGKDPELAALGDRIVAAQRLEIAMMKRWLERHDNRKLPAADNAEVRAFRTSMAAMHKAMNIEYTGDADVDFARGMIGHHQGAIDMAAVLLEYGRDPALRDMAHDVVRSQGQEIEFMQDWLKRKK